MSTFCVLGIMPPLNLCKYIFQIPTPKLITDVFPVVSTICSSIIMTILYKCYGVVQLPALPGVACFCCLLDIVISPHVIQQHLKWQFPLSPNYLLTFAYNTENQGPYMTPMTIRSGCFRKRILEFTAIHKSLPSSHLLQCNSRCHAHKLVLISKQLKLISINYIIMNISNLILPTTLWMMPG